MTLRGYRKDCFHIKGSMEMVPVGHRAQRGWMGISVAAEEHLSVTDGFPPAKPQMDLGSSGPHHNFLLPINTNVFFFLSYPSSPVFPYPACLAFCWGGWVVLEKEGAEGEKKGRDSLVEWPAVCQLCASRTLSGVEKGLLSPTRTHSPSPFTPQTLAL